jgi:Tol biopolymer transport system component
MMDCKNGAEMKNLTPDEYRCQLGMCPAVYEDGDQIVIVGERAEGIPSVGPGEEAVRVPREMLAQALGSGHKKAPYAGA